MSKLSVNENCGSTVSRVAGDLGMVRFVSEVVGDVDGTLASEMSLVEKQDVNFLLMNEVNEFKAPLSDTLTVLKLYASIIHFGG